MSIFDRRLGERQEEQKRRARAQSGALARDAATTIGAVPQPQTSAPVDVPRIPPQSTTIVTVSQPVTDSSARFLSGGWSPDSESTPDPKAEARRDRLLLPVLNDVARESALARVIWSGKNYELARKVRDELGAAWEEPGKFTAALKVACDQYMREDGTLFTPKVLREGLRQYDAKSKGFE